MICGGIDLGGSKIEARLFEGAEARTVDAKRVPTPGESYDALLAALGQQVAWLEAQAGRADLPVGIAVPGFLDPETGRLFAANLVASGHPLARDLNAQVGREVVAVNDCMGFTLSEAVGGAGDAYHSVMGLILGTGVGGGLALGRQLAPRHGGVGVEIGHVGAPARSVARHGLPLFPCGCGRLGCIETYMSGTGLANIAEHKLGQRLSAEALVAEGQDACLEIWADIAGECLVTIQLTLAPDCIVLGGGLSNMPGIADRLRDAMAGHALTDMALPEIVVAKHGDSSGARGAALLALQVEGLSC
ncbi:MAG: ROK family protein [Pseudomonadota bacterium]